ncbi:MAG: hypothetical protein AB8B87_06550 [Granulosicoccus sp.]
MHAISQAAHLLNTSEFKLVSEAYLAWFGDRPDDNDIMNVFSQFMMFGELPDWADQFARSVLDDLKANRQVNLNSFSVLNLSPRVGKRPEISFSIVK